RARLDGLTKVGDDVGGSRDIAGEENRLHTWHRLRGADVDVAGARMRQRTQEQPGIEHPVGLVVFRVLRLTRDLRYEIRRNVVLSDEFAAHSSCPRLISWSPLCRA